MDRYEQDPPDEHDDQGNLDPGSQETPELHGIESGPLITPHENGEDAEEYTSPPTDYSLPAENVYHPEGPGERPSPALTDALFDVLAQTEPLTTAERRDLLSRTKYLDWLGVYTHAQPTAVREFEAIRPRDEPEYPGVLAHEASRQIVVRQLTQRYRFHSGFMVSLAGVTEGIDAVKGLYRLVRDYGERGAVVTMSPELENNGDVFAGQYTIRTMPELEVTADRPPYVRESFAPEYLRHDHPNGEIRLIDPSAKQRYRIVPEFSGATTTHETIITLGPTSQAYLANLQPLLQNHAQLLVAVAAAAGVRPESLYHPGTNQVRWQDTEISSKVDRLYRSDKLPQDLIDQLTQSTIEVWSALRYRQTYNEETGEIEKLGLAGWPYRRQLQDYFKALLEQ